MKKLITLILLFVAFPLFGFATAPSLSAAAEIKDNLCSGVEQNLNGGSCGRNTGRDAENRLNDLIGTIVNVLTVIIGIVAVIMIIVGGFRFITSGGDASKVTSAKQTVIYAIVGLVIVALAQFIVRFILSNT